MNKTISEIAAEYSRFTRELSELDQRWTQFITLRVSNLSTPGNLAADRSTYEDFQTKFVEMQATYFSVMERLDNEIATLKASGSVPYSVTRLRTQLRNFNRDHKVASHLVARLLTMDELINLSIEATQENDSVSV